MSANNFNLWPLQDRLGWARAVINDAGALKDSLAYDSFGNITSETDSAFRGWYAWTGRQLDVETDRQYDHARS